MQPPAERPLEIADASVHLGGRAILTEVRMYLNLGELVVLLGHNGSGKTTLVKALLGLVPLSAGVVRLFGAPVSRFKGWQRIGYVPQRVTAASGVPATVEEVVASGRVGRGRIGRGLVRGDRTATDRALEAVDLGGSRRAPVGSLSGGQQQRVLIARALARDPDVLVLDEPVASVDLAHQETFAGTLRDLRSSGTGILLVSHTLGAIQPLVDRAIVLDRGGVVFDGPPSDEVLEHVEPHHHHHAVSEDPTLDQGRGPIGAGGL